MSCKAPLLVDPSLSWLLTGRNGDGLGPSARSDHPCPFIGRLSTPPPPTLLKGVDGGSFSATANLYAVCDVSV